MVFLVNMQGKDMSEEESLAERMSREEEDNPGITERSTQYVNPNFDPNLASRNLKSDGPKLLDTDCSVSVDGMCSDTNSLPSLGNSQKVLQ